MRYIRPFPLMIAALLTSVIALAANGTFELSLKDHQFTPSQLSIPANKRVKLTIKNLDSTPAEFESNFKAEKVIPGVLRRFPRGSD